MRQRYIRRIRLKADPTFKGWLVAEGSEQCVVTWDDTGNSETAVSTTWIENDDEVPRG